MGVADAKRKGLEPGTAFVSPRVGNRGISCRRGADGRSDSEFDALRSAPRSLGSTYTPLVHSLFCG
jgi:hypothetical protein